MRTAQSQRLLSQNEQSSLHSLAPVQQCRHRGHRRGALLTRAAGNTFGHSFRVTTFGESHGKGVGCVIDGVPPRLPITKEEIQVRQTRCQDLTRIISCRSVVT